LLAANTIAGLESYDIADFAEITHPVQLAILDREEPLNLKTPITRHCPLESHVPASQAFILQRVVQIGSTGSEGLILAMYLHHRAISGGGKQLSVQDR